MPQNTQRATNANERTEEVKREYQIKTTHQTDTCNAILVVKNLESTVLILLYKNAVDVVVVCCALVIVISIAACLFFF